MGWGKAGFSKPTLAASTNMNAFHTIRAQSTGTIDAEPGLAWDRSGGLANGRVYLVYSAAPSRASLGDTNVYFRYSNNNGRKWSRAIRVNDDATRNSQFLPRIALDQTTGNIAMSWHDSRSDTGSGPGTTNGIANDDAQFWGAVGKPTSAGVILSPNFQISAGTSNADRAGNSIDFGDYTGLAFQSGVMTPTWADNSNSTHDNPDGRLHQFDMYGAPIEPAFDF